MDIDEQLEEERNYFQSRNDSNIIPIDFSIIEDIDKTELPGINVNPDTMLESIQNISDMYERFGKEYGIELKYDVGSVSSTFKSILSSNAESVFKVYLAKSFTKVKLAVFNKILISITTLIDRITQEELLESDNVELSVSLIDKMLDMMERLNRMSPEIEIKSADTVLKQVSRSIVDNKEGNESDLSDSNVMKTLKLLKQLKN